MEIGIIGCGYVGLVTGACLAELGHRVVAVDSDERKLSALQRGECPIYEPGLAELVATHYREGRLQFVDSIRQVVERSLVIFICVNTPSGPDGSADLRFVEAVSQEIALNLSSYRLIVDKSTVPVQTGEKVAKTISRYAQAGVPFDVASNPEFLREGTALRDFFQPDRVVIGSSSTRASSLLVELYAPLNAPLLLTDINSAELIKHSANAFLALKISFINAVARVCELAGADIKKVAAGVGLDHRIGLESMEAGIGYGGMCLPKDVAAYIRLAKGLGYDFQLLEAVQEVNNQQRQWPVRLLESQVTPLEGAKVALWGLSFKPHTDDLRSAPALEIIESLLARGVKVSCYDPAAMPKAALLYPQVEMAADPYAACQGAQALIICTEWPQFKSVDLERLAQLLERPLIIDGRNIFEPQRLAALNFQYFSVGRAPAAPIAQATTDRDR